MIGSPRSRIGRGAVIIPLRPDVQVDADVRPVEPLDTAAEAPGETRDPPHQLSLFDEGAER
jgi:hypothetical protein